MGISYDDRDDVLIKGDDGSPECEGAPIAAIDDGGVTRLAVDAKLTGVGSTAALGCTTPKLRYVDMNASSGGVARDTIIDTTWTNVFSYSGSGMVYGWILSLEDNKKWQIRFLIDGNEIFDANGIYTPDTADASIYGLNRNFQEIAASGINFNEKTSPFYWSGPLNFPVCYESSVVIKVKRIAGEASKKFKAGLVVLTKET